MAGLKKEEIIRSKKELEILFDRTASSVAAHREGGMKILCRIKVRVPVEEEKEGIIAKRENEEISKAASAIKIYPAKPGEESDKQLALKIEVLFSVGKKTEPKATRRNRIKRLMREVFRLNKEKIYKHASNLGLKNTLQLVLLYAGGSQKKTAIKKEESKKKKSKLPSYQEFEEWITKGCEKVIRKTSLKL